MASVHVLDDSRLQGYNVKKLIGKGSYGEVFLVMTRDGRKKYVMKNINLTSTSAKERLGAEQEAALLSRLHHPNIVSYKESFQDESGVLHIIMGYCEGGDLCSRLKTYKNNLLSETKVVEWFVQIALGLQYLHERNILHRDLKTQNIFLSKNDIIKVGDLGIARVLDGSCDLAHTVVGTPYYMSPELFANQPYNHKSDIWALGCCVYEIASLKHAFSARNINALMYKIIRGKFPPIPAQYSMELVCLVHQMMARNADGRPNVHEILRMPFIHKHIKMFLDRAATRKRKGRPPVTPYTRPESSTQERKTSDRECRVHQVASAKQAEKTDSNGHRNAACNEVDIEIKTRKQIKQCPAEISFPSDQVNASNKERKGVDTVQPLEPCQQKQKVSRPLPPDPTHALGNISDKGEVVSSARQRRRMSKQLQEGRGKTVFKSQSSSSISKGRVESDGPHVTDTDEHVEDDSESSRHVEGDSGPKESSQHVESGSGPDEHSQHMKNDGDPIESSHSSLDESGQHVDSNSGESISEGSQHEFESSQHVEGDSGPFESSQHVEGDSGPVESSQHLESDGGPVESSQHVESDGGLGERSQHVDGTDPCFVELSDEMNEFYTLLDTTLHLTEADCPFTAPHPLSSPTPSAASEREAWLPSGRLAERIRALRLECESGLGISVVNQVMKLLTRADPEEAEEDLILVLGMENFELFAAKLQQLKLCEDSLYTHPTLIP